MGLKRRGRYPAHSVSAFEITRFSHARKSRENFRGSQTGEAEGVTRSFVNRLLRLTLLAPEIVEAILEGRQPKAVQLEELTDAIPSSWEKQRKALLSGAA